MKETKLFTIWNDVEITTSDLFKAVAAVFLGALIALFVIGVNFKTDYDPTAPKQKAEYEQLEEQRKAHDATYKHPGKLGEMGGYSPVPLKK